MASHNALGGRRDDIQSLRGIAVLMVVFYHAGLGGMTAGYLGVDMFFVISGYLITRIIAREVDAGTFTFREFYLRRTRRILPALFAVVLVTALFADFFLSSEEMQSFKAQVIGSLTFTANIVLWRQVDYFGVAAELKPLLHIWSLAIEEQYYILMPLLLVFTPKRFRMLAVVLVVAYSLIMMIGMISFSPGMTFYLVVFRAWELGFGSIAALLPAFSVGRRLSIAAGGAGLAVLVSAAYLPWPGPHPGLAAIMVCSATVAVILFPVRLLAEGIVARSLGWVGDISYALYLVHWPILAFANNANADDGWMTRGSLLLVSFGVAVALKRLVEDPFRHGRGAQFRRMATGLAALGCLAVLSPYAVEAMNKREAGLKGGRAVANGFDIRCNYHKSMEDLSSCRNSEKPRIAIWGHSHAMHIVPAVVSTTPEGVIQSTKAGCGPILGIAPTNRTQAEKWPHECIAFNRDTFRHITESDDIRIVVLAARMHEFRETDYFAEDGDEARRLASREVMEHFGRTVEALRANGKRVVFVASPPGGPFNLGICVERRWNNKIFLGASRDCSVSREESLAYNPRAVSAMDNLQDIADIDIITLDEALCEGDRCLAVIGDVMLYRDGDHLTPEGSRLVGQRMDLASQIEARAR